MRDPRDGASLREAAARDGLALRVARLDVTRPETLDLPAGLRVLVNNAGLEGRQLPVEHAPSAEWRELFETNLFGLLEVTRRAIPKLRAAGGGVVCNLTTASLLVPMPFFAAYRASKAAVSALGESLRAELAPFGIRLLEILPGATDTDMLRRSDHPPEAAALPDYREMAERVHQARLGSASLATAADRVASSIADAILDDAAPLRSRRTLWARMLSAWRKQDDEAGMRPMLSLFTGGKIMSLKMSKARPPRRPSARVRPGRSRASASGLQLAARFVRVAGTAPAEPAASARSPSLAARSPCRSCGTARACPRLRLRSPSLARARLAGLAGTRGRSPRLRLRSPSARCALRLRSGGSRRGNGPRHPHFARLRLAARFAC